MRIWSCLTVAEAIAEIWPGRHGQWIAVTVAIVLGRRLTAPPTRLLQRALGTMLGVVIAGLLLIWTPPPLIVTCEIAALAAARPVLRAGNYAAYAVVMTPLIVLLLDFGQAISVAILADRLMATIAGCHDHVVVRLFAVARQSASPWEPSEPRAVSEAGTKREEPNSSIRRGLLRRRILGLRALLDRLGRARQVIGAS